MREGARFTPALFERLLEEEYEKLQKAHTKDGKAGARARGQGLAARLAVADPHRFGIVIVDGGRRLQASGVAVCAGRTGSRTEEEAA